MYTFVLLGFWFLHGLEPRCLMKDGGEVQWSKEGIVQPKTTPS